MDSKAYRPDIDGLRAVAVLAVLAFHLDFTLVSGGFVGVDIFFVISGFLITRLILKETRATGTFRFGHFYLRRVRRLFPALFTMQLVSMVVGIILLSPPQLERMGGALLHSLVSLSNFFFWSESGYFDTASDAKPLLHTWSLAVEEQFYLLWPLLIFVLIRPAHRLLQPAILVAIGFFSLYLNFSFGDGDIPWITAYVPDLAANFSNGATTIFFLTPFRVFEFVIGALVVWIMPLKPDSRALRETSLITGFALMGYAIFSYDRSTPFPSVNALVPCIGAALAIYGGQAPYSGVLLRNPLAVALGKISYSLYLVHWPLIVFWKYYTLEPLGIIHQIALALTSGVLATAMYIFVEKRFRYPSEEDKTARNLRFGLASALLTILIMIPASSMWSLQGWQWRVPKDMVRIQYDAVNALHAHLSNPIGSQETFDDDHISAISIGNSFALDVALMLRSHPKTQVYYEGTTGQQCRGFTLQFPPEIRQRFTEPYDCDQNIDRFTASYPDADVIILAGAQTVWETNDPVVMDEVFRNIQRLRDAGFQGPIVMYGERPLFMQDIPDIAFRHGRISGFNKLATDKLQFDISEMRDRAARAETFYSENGVYHYTPLPLLCPDELCELMTPDGELLYMDRFHYTPAGHEFLVDDFVNFLLSLEELAHFREPVDRSVSE